MFRLFSYLAAIAVLLLSISGGGIMWIASRAIDQAREDAVGALAKGIGLSIAAQIELLGGSLDKMAQDPRVAQAIAGRDPETLRQTGAGLARLLPHAYTVRLLLPGVTELDDKTSPPMTYADLNMVRETFSTQHNPLPAIQGESPNHRHLAIARKIVQGGQTIGVLLASFDDAIIRASIGKAAVDNGYIKLRQAKLILGSAGQAPGADEDDRLQIPIAGTQWQLAYGTQGAAFSLESNLMLMLVVTPLGLMLAAFMLGYKLLSRMLLEDLRSTMRAFKDMMKNNFHGNYATRLSEMKGFIFTLSQYKRVLERDGNDAEGVDKGADDDFEFSGFSTDTFDLNFEAKAAAPPKAKTVKIPQKDGPVFKKPSKPGAPQQPEPKPEPKTPAPARAELTLDKAPAVAKRSDDMPATNPQDSIFRAYDIRGIVDKTLTKAVMYDIGRALGSEAKAQGCDTIVLARDGRLSSPGFSNAVADGIVSCGCDVLDIGMAPTPVLYFVAHHIEDRSGVMVTGSHNPAEYNGVKMVIKGETLASERIQDLKRCIEDQAFTTAPTPGSIEKNERFANEYLGTVADDVHLGRPMKIVVDCGNGVTGDIAPKLLRTIGCEIIELYCEINGAFPNHHPDPSRPENLQELIMAVKHYQADLGLAFDGDGDRLGVVDSSGKIIWPDRQMMLYAQNVLAARPGAEIVYDVKCSRQLAKHIEKLGGRPTLWKTGHSLMKAKIQETGAALAGEMSGHIFFNDRWFGFDDALYTAARLIEILSEDSRTSADVFAALPDSINTPELHVMLEEGENVKIIDVLSRYVNFPGAEITMIDGIRADFPNGFGLVRASNTTPSLMFRFEADDRGTLKNIQQQFSELLKTVKPDISLPF